MEFFSALGEYEFLQNALLAGLLASIGCGVIGTLVVVKRITFIAGGIAHSVLAGMGAAIFYGFSPLAGALIAAIVAAILIGSIHHFWRTQEDTLIGAIWAIGMAIGILFISQTPGYQNSMLDYLFGNILMVSDQNLLFMVILDGLLLLLFGAFHRQFLAVIFDNEHAQLRGIPTFLFYQLLLIMIAVTVVLLIQIVGLILVLALLTLPAASAALMVNSLGKMIIIATLLGMLESSAGLMLSYGPDLPTGPVIILMAGTVYLAIALGLYLYRRLARSQSSSRLPLSMDT